MTEQVVEDPVLKQRYVFRRTGDVLQVEVWVDPGGGVVPHVHPTFEERFRILSGEVTFEVGRETLVAGAGEEAVVPAGARHTYRNEGFEQAHFVTDASPPVAALQGFLEDAAALSRAGKMLRPGIPGPRGLLPAAVMARHYRPHVRLLFPPMAVQRLILDPLAGLAERRGLRAGALG
ncbi:MAG TPA: cupin domain-containing protein [Thermoleophilaceae bacterium]|nr:cupin domain-containing protein [Thermoleophilaceae bacterium]